MKLYITNIVMKEREREKSNYLKCNDKSVWWVCASSEKTLHD